jgi:hypothetical protein
MDVGRFGQALHGFTNLFADTAHGIDPSAKSGVDPLSAIYSRILIFGLA